MNESDLAAQVSFMKEQVNELKEQNKDFEKRITGLEAKKEKTEYQYDQIMKAINKLNDVTIPNVLKEIESLKNKPAKRWETVITALISGVVAFLVSFIASH